MTSRSARVAALVGVCAIAGSAAGTGAAHATTGAPSGGWTVDTSNCSDPDRANAPIEGTVRIGSAMPLSGGAAAAAFAPVAQGLQTYITYANEQGLLPGYTLEVTIGDDQYDPALTPGVVQGIIDGGVDLFAGDIGTQQNLAVRDTLNEECIPQINLLTGDPAWGYEAEEYPWTTGLLIPYDTESRGYVQSIVDNFPGSKIGVFYVNNEFGNVYMDAFKEAADAAGLEIIAEQTVENGDEAPPQAQVAALADAAPDVIMATPLGAQCPTFMTEMANQLAVRTDWHPAVYITNTCASPLILGIAGANADGLYTSASMGLADVANPDVQTGNPAAAAYIAEMNKQGFGDVIATAAAGWNVGEVTLAILQNAAESSDGLTQASIINAARNLTFRPTLLRDNLHEYVMNGLDDTFYSEDVQVVQYDATAGHFNDIGDPYSFETSAG